MFEIDKKFDIFCNETYAARIHWVNLDFVIAGMSPYRFLGNIFQNWIANIFFITHGLQILKNMELLNTFNQCIKLADTGIYNAEQVILAV